MSVYNAVKTHCPQGHEYTIENTAIHTDGSRRCRACVREKYARIAVNPDRAKTLHSECAHGHKYVSGSYSINLDGHKVCRVCRRLKAIYTIKGTHNSNKRMCVRGHLFDVANTLITRDGYRQCRKCIAERARETRNKEKHDVELTNSA